MSSALIRTRGALAAAAVAAVAVLFLAACGVGEPPAGTLGQPVELDDVNVTLVDVSGSGGGYIEWEVTATKDGASCPTPPVYVDAGDGTRFAMGESTSWSCTVLSEGETGRARLLATDGPVMHAGQTVVWTDANGDVLATWVLP